MRDHYTKAERLDGAAVEGATEHTLRAVRMVASENQEEHNYGAIVHQFYGDGTQMLWSLVTVVTEESLA